MMLIKLFLFFLVLLILPDMYIYKAYIRRVSQKMDTLGLLASQSVSFIGNDISLFYTRATSGFHAAT